MTDVTTLLTASRLGSPTDANELFQLLYLELRRLAHDQVSRHAAPPVQTTTLVHEAYLRFHATGKLQLKDRQYFLAYASHVMRSVLVDQARSELAEKRGAGIAPVTLNPELANSATASNEDVINVHEALRELAVVDERLAKIVEMKYFGGLTEEEIADVLELTSRTVQRDWRKARLFLSACLQDA